MKSTSPDIGLFDIFSGLVSDLDFKPTVHINYENAVLPIRDGLPKLKDMPADRGGNGEEVAYAKTEDFYLGGRD